MKISLKNTTSILKAEFIGFESNLFFENISIDSRSFQNNQNTLFFCLVGKNNDAHVYIKELIEKGVQNFVVHEVPENYSSKANFFIVKNSLVALQKMAIYYRNLFQFPIIGITGSNGKTIVKEWLNFLLSPDFNIVRSPKSYNSQVGVPLSVFGINENNNFGIFEAGISLVGEMENLEKIIQPKIGILTNIGSAHSEGFQDLNEKIAEKLELFLNSDILIFNKNESIDRFINPNLKTFTWSFDNKNANVFIEKKSIQNNTFLKIIQKNKVFDVEIPFQDDASIENSISCLMVLLYLNYDSATIQNRLKMLFPLEMRLKVKNGINSITLIDDSYSSDIQSLTIALDFLESQKQYKKKTVILSDIFQSGENEIDLYQKVAQLLESNSIDRVFLIGSIISKYESFFKNFKTYNSKKDFISDFENLDFEKETILIKGARNFQFEEIVSLLEEKTHETVLEINLNSISHNYNFYKQKLKPNTKIMVMVKAFGYGNGGFEIAKLLEHHQVDYLGVAFADEGISLKTAGIKTSIMVLNPETSSFSSIIQHNLEPEIYSLKGLKTFIKIANQKNLNKYPIHIKLDTGMHRLGFEEAQIDELIQTLEKNECIEIKSILSHMAASDDLEHLDFSNLQIDLFQKLSSKLISSLKINPIRHLLNTSGISNFPNAQFDMVRLGIGLYGISNDPEEQKLLENVSTLKSVISQIRTIKKGESVGYGRRFIAYKKTIIATIPIGYADGVSRLWGNEIGYVLIKNKRAHIIGSICMDMLMVDVTEIDCAEGNEVIIFGNDPSVNLIAQKTDTISYEILTSVSQRVKRVFYRE